MNALVTFLSEGVSWLGDVTVQATVLLGVVAVGLLPIWRLSAARRYAVVSAGLLALPVLVVCTLLWPDWRLEAANDTIRLSVPGAAIEGLFHEVTGNADVPAPPPVWPGSEEAKAVGMGAASWLGAVVLTVWWAGILVGGTNVGFGWLRLRRLSRGCEVEGDRRLLRTLERVTGEMGVSADLVRLVRHAECGVPMTWGMRRCTILLPAGAAAWPEARLLLVLRHEVAHVARGDVRMSLLVTLGSLVFWFHPLVWWLRRVCAEAGEAACDDLALAKSDAGREEFAEELLGAVTTLGRRPWAGLAVAMAAADKKALKRRLAAILESGRQRAGWGPRQRMVVRGLVMTAAVVLSGLAACRKGPAVAPDTRQIQVTSKVFSVPMGSPVLEEFGLTLNAESGTLDQGVLDEKRMGELVHSLTDMKDVKLVASPSVVTRSGQRADIEIVREVIYPTEFDPPRIPDRIEGGAKAGEGVTPVTPTTPTAFEMRPVGVRVGIDPVISKSGEIEMRLTPEVSRFEGMINYGTPITGDRITAEGKLEKTILSENRIQMPVFHTMKLNSSVSLKSGQCVVMGGLGERENMGPPREDPKRFGDAGAPQVGFGARQPPLAFMPEAGELVFFVIQAKIMGR